MPLKFKRCSASCARPGACGPPMSSTSSTRRRRPVTPTAQVHRGVLDGREVAVKVLRPGLAGSVRQDLSLLEGLIAPLAAAFPALGSRSDSWPRSASESSTSSTSSTRPPPSAGFTARCADHPLFTVPAPLTRALARERDGQRMGHGVPLATPRTATPPQPASSCSCSAACVRASSTPTSTPTMSSCSKMAVWRSSTSGPPGSSTAPAPSRPPPRVEAFVAADAQTLGHALGGLGMAARRARGGGTGAGRSRAWRARGTRRRSGWTRARCWAAGERAAERPRQLLELMLAGALRPEDLWPARAVAGAVWHDRAGRRHGTVARADPLGPARRLGRAPAGPGG